MQNITGEKQENAGTNRIIWIIMGIGVLVLAAVVAYLVMLPSTPPSSAMRLEDRVREGVLREGAEFEAIRQKIGLLKDLERTTESPSVMRGIQMNVFGIVRNFTGRTITGLELVGMVIDQKGNAVKERTTVVIPNKQPRLEPNAQMSVNVLLDGFEDKDDRADVRWRVTAVKVE